ncbi:hypothetical protein H6S82_00885 [Planktothrix sp. FACHB-1355]|uniref:Uncharacterized protein n=1 Tax=Aerosakkonema funiforme FACHB-1375 TaxID=2949571 RepID=A0A926VD42_9CYAN|nr:MULTISPECIES: hypothetical protein [Oscillatoriales]MBD2180329.1 hypothetical protein [Aerosakkonema funiforme FACHB-1375]MBD3557424.1 hypothetical protein [Planktothrix sp. FACHB-1355]
MIRQQLICDVSPNSLVNSFDNPGFKSLVIFDNQEYLEIQFTQGSLKQLTEIIAHLTRLQQLLVESKKQDIITQLNSLNLPVFIPNNPEKPTSIVAGDSDEEIPF